MLSSHRQSVLTNACIKPSVDPITRTPGTLYEPKGQVRLLGLLSESSSSQQEDYLDAGDGMLICTKRSKRNGHLLTHKGCWEAENIGPNVSEASYVVPDPNPSRRQEVVEGEPAPAIPDPSAAPARESPRQPRPGSFPFHWMWESFSVKGQAVYRSRSAEKAKQRRSLPSPSASAREPPCTPAPAAGSAEDLQEPGSPRGPGVPRRNRHQKGRQHVDLPPGSSLLPLHWKMEARSEARQRQLRQERRRWLQLTQQLLSLDDQAPRREKRCSAKQLEERLAAELLCLATEPPEPGPQRETAKSRAQTAKEELTFQPIINRRIPNFKSLQRRFQEQLKKKKEQAKLTICKPFHLQSASSSQPLSGDDEKEDQEDPFYEVRRLLGVQWRAQSCPDLGPPLVRPVMPTKTSDKRQEANRLLLLEWERRERQEKRRAEVRRAREQQVQREVAKCLAAYRSLSHPAVSFQRKREDLRKQEKLRMEEYSLQLQEIQDRVESRPYLFERVMQANARQAVERRFSQVLAALGIDEGMLRKHAARQATGKSSAKTIRRRPESAEDASEST